MFRRDRELEYKAVKEADDLRRAKEQQIEQVPFQLPFPANFTKSITVTVGTNPQVEIHVPKDVLCLTSVYFKRVLRNELREPRLNCFVFRHQDPEIFNIYLNWLYGRGILLKPHDGLENTHENSVSEIGEEGEKDNDQRQEDDDKLEFQQLAKAYVFGDYILDEVFSADIIKEFYAKAAEMSEWCDESWPFDVLLPLQYIYDNTAENSCLRNAVALICACTVDMEKAKIFAIQGQLPNECFVDVMQKLIMLRGTDNVWAYSGIQIPCHYHIDYHEDDTSGKMCFSRRAHLERKRRYSPDKEGPSSPRKRFRGA